MNWEPPDPVFSNSQLRGILYRHRLDRLPVRLLECNTLNIFDFMSDSSSYRSALPHGDPTTCQLVPD
jgi:hypothetical protein